MQCQCRVFILCIIIATAIDCIAVCTYVVVVVGDAVVLWIEFICATRSTRTIYIFCGYIALYIDGNDLSDCIYKSLVVEYTTTVYKVKGYLKF